jgi:hypothetical protein
MPDQSKQMTRIDMQPEEIIRSMKQRDRICLYMEYTGSIWCLLLVIVVTLDALFHLKSNPINVSIEWTVAIISIAIGMVAFAMRLAIYRCPLCDQYLGRLGNDKLHCPNCNAKVK